MYRTAVSLLKVLAILAVIAGMANVPALAQDTLPPSPDLSPYLIDKQDGKFSPDRPGPEGKGHPPSRAAASQSRPVLSPQLAGGPDDYGYTWDDSVAFEWIDASGGTNVGLQGDDEHTSAIDIGFDFKFYENTYSQLSISTNGLVTFEEGRSYYSSQNYIPSPASPNNFIAPFWSDLCVECMGATGAVYTMQGGAAPNRYFVVEWRNVIDLWGDDSPLDFEAILFENGDILIQYRTIPVNFYNSTIGIEDGDGIVGLRYFLLEQDGVSSKAVRFYRPAPSARLKMWPLHQGSFTHPGETVAFQTSIYNTGELGSDIYDLSVTASWPVNLFAADGTTPLADTDGDGTVDTGAIAPGDRAVVTAKVTTPDAVTVGNHHSAHIQARSSADNAKQKTTSLTSAIPAPFAQSLSSVEDGAMSLLLVQPADQVLKKASPGWIYGNDMAVAETPNGFAYFWSRSRYTDNTAFSEIEYTLVDHFGQTNRGVHKLSSISTSDIDVYEGNIAVAAAPDGRIGVVWYRSRYDWTNGTQNENIYYAILDAAGSILIPPTSLTNNTLWGGWDEINIPMFENPRIEATDDNRFTIGWVQYHDAGPAGNCSGYCQVSDIYYTIRDTSGGVVKPATKFTADTPGWDQGYNYLNLASLTGSRVLFVYYQGSDDLITYAVLDSSGNTVKSQASTGSGGWGPDAVQLSNGSVVIAWNAWETRFVVLDEAYNITAGPTTLSNRASATGNAYVSVAADQDGHAILTWMNEDWNSPNLYYALVNSFGDVLTPPMIFHTVEGEDSSVYTSYDGYGNTSYSWTPPAEVDGVVSFRSSFAGGQPDSTAGIGLQVANHGAAPASGVVLTATLDSGLIYAGDTSGITPTVNGNEIAWELPDLGFLDVQEFSIIVRLPQDANYGDRYAVTLNLAADGQDADAKDNTGAIEVMVARQVFLPLTTKGR